MLIQGILLIASLSPCLSMRCLECTGMPRPDDCDTVTQCVDGSKCFVDQVVTQGGLVMFNLGCRSIARCNAHKRDLPEVGTELQHSKRADLVTCQDCCDDKDFCNNQGCGTTVEPMSTRGVFCFECNAQSAENACRRITECDNQETCALREKTASAEYTTQCISKLQCLGVIKATIADAQAAMNQGGLVGKRAAVFYHPVCCNTDFCNDHWKFANGSTGGQTIDYAR